jgi:hypothetical protein
MTVAEVRRIVLSMPETEEKAHVGRPDFRVKNKIFATIVPSKNRVVVKLSIPDQSALVAMHPSVFAVNSWSHPGWTNVELKEISKREFRNVVRAAWRNVAPKRLVMLHEPAARKNDRGRAVPAAEHAVAADGETASCVRRERGVAIVRSRRA